MATPGPAAEQAAIAAPKATALNPPPASPLHAGPHPRAGSTSQPVRVLPAIGGGGLSLGRVTSASGIRHRSNMSVVALEPPETVRLSSEAPDIEEVFSSACSLHKCGPGHNMHVRTDGSGRQCFAPLHTAWSLYHPSKFLLPHPVPGAHPPPKKKLEYQAACLLRITITSSF